MSSKKILNRILNRGNAHEGIRSSIRFRIFNTRVICNKKTSWRQEVLKIIWHSLQYLHNLFSGSSAGNYTQRSQRNLEMPDNFSDYFFICFPLLWSCPDSYNNLFPIHSDKILMKFHQHFVFHFGWLKTPRTGTILPAAAIWEWPIRSLTRGFKKICGAG